MPGAGREPARPQGRGILSPLRLPVSPPGQLITDFYWLVFRKFYFLWPVLRPLYEKPLRLPLRFERSTEPYYPILGLPRSRGCAFDPLLR